MGNKEVGCGLGMTCMPALGAQVDIPEDHKAKAQEWREKLIDMVVEQDDDVLAAYFEVRETREGVNEARPAAAASSIGQVVDQGQGG